MKNVFIQISTVKSKKIRFSKNPFLVCLNIVIIPFSQNYKIFDKIVMAVFLSVRGI